MAIKSKGERRVIPEPDLSANESFYLSSISPQKYHQLGLAMSEKESPSFAIGGYAFQNPDN